MKKKFITVALSMVLCLSMGMTALAAPSAAASDVPKNQVLSAFGDSTDEQYRTLLNAVLKKNPGAGMQVLQVTGATDIDENSSLYNANEGTVHVPSDGLATKGQTGWYVIHFADTGNGLSEVKAVYPVINIAADNTLVAVKPESDGFSYFAGIQLASAATPSNVTPGNNTNQTGPGVQGASNSTNGPASTGSGSGSTAAPKTGDFATPIVAEVVALVSVAGIALYVKKSAAR